VIYDVVIVGYGPTGMLAAILLGRAGHRVAVLERHKTLYNLPRVGIVHDDILRMFQEIGIIERIWPATKFLPTYELAKHGKVLLSSDVAPYATHGWPEYISIYQPAFEAELDAVAKSLPNVDVRQGDRVIAITQDHEQVEVTVEGEAGDKRSVRGRYLIGADGGNSLVRQALGVAYEDLGFDQDWLVIDAKAKRPRPDLPMMRQFCEPEQPGVTLAMGPQHRRWSFMIFPDESAEAAMRPDNVWRRLDRPEGATPDEYELIRVASYKFQSLFAERWRVGRTFLAGDAAHQMPPFLAQGMCSGFRDAYNLAWKLDLVLQGKAPPALLDTYMAERGPNAHATIVESMRVGQHVNERDPEKVRMRDMELVALQAAKHNTNGSPQLIAFRVPGMTAGFIGRSDGACGAGDAFIQGKVRRRGSEGPFDDVAGRGFMIVSRHGDAAAALGPDDCEFWRSLGGAILRLEDAAAGDDPDAVIDLDQRYGRLMDEYGCDVIVKRPDHYIFAACRSVAELPAVIADVRQQLRAGGQN
jgi:2-polyprenyl-6-methoxyphenol hydroxylase-like FAD-dependent oxidoreductase